MGTDELRDTLDGRMAALGARLNVDPSDWPAMLAKVEKLAGAFDPVPEDQFQSELERLINQHSKENGSNTHDFVLAQYLVHCLEAFDYATRYREQVQNSQPLDPRK